MDKAAHSEHSTLREHIVEHVLVGEILRALWRKGVYDVEVLRSEFDAHGYDMILTRGPVVRHIQFKTGTKKPTGKGVSVPLVLAQKIGGCVLFIQVDDDLNLRTFWVYGGGPMEMMPDVTDFTIPKRATHTVDGVRPERLKHRLILPGRFERIDGIDALIEFLFGSLDDVPPLG